MIILIIICVVLLVVVIFSNTNEEEKEKIDNALKLIDEYRNKNEYIIDKFTYHDIDRKQVNEMLNRISYSLTREKK